ncbi:zinc transport system permease protein [Maritalea mobilis]|uniref:High-affinity zinc uptake system membrane protein ZnuB n=1 Tax=Maritalea mobilis TaxID=483324 RepID=A0A4R6VIM0_9HYPH|nr:zinc ABC transporter permease subunit ZnuB [Maritalea mobilis]TDQ61532.1 zinc transport system permease protein [Maritalea mobilis]
MGIFDDFFMRALIGGIGFALVTGPLGCFIVWRRMAYFGDTMAHSALLGVALSFVFNLNLMVGVIAVALMVSFALMILEKRQSLSADALLGILSHSTLALGLVIVSLMTSVRIDLMALLFGDILAVTTADIQMVYGLGAVVLGILIWFWRPLIAATVNVELAQAENMKPQRTRFILMVLLALLIAIAMKIVGILLITALLIIPAATARRFAATPEIMAVLASILGVVAVIGGLYGSLYYDTPSGPSIVVAALVIFLISLVPKNLFGPKNKVAEAPHD